MSIYVLMDYITNCKRNKINPTTKGLKAYKMAHWRE